MIDVQEFGRLYRDKLMSLAAESRGVMRIEAVRKYHTDTTFHAQVEAMVQAAVQTILDMEKASGFDPLREQFEGEVNSLLGWR